ncbi:MAG: DNA polymerase III subunit gamma/tau [Clostridiales bacterium]|jgi:DNA polymerase III subunit gamma/tau|nr:DNA polymerase III subunit gamma/tau [Clostridiales bacterium]
MAYQSLYRTYRTKTFSEMVGQDPIVKALKNQAATGRVAHAYLFCGSRGTGKTSAARTMALAINCLEPREGDPCLTCANCLALQSETTLDVFEMDAASNSRVEEIREMLSRTDYPPQFVKYKVYIIDEVHMLSNAAFNALLKTLEEPPNYMVFILATTEPQKLPATILSRCQRFDFARISEEEIIKRLNIALTPDMKAEDGALRLIASAAQGSMRDAWSLMDMCIGMNKTLSEDNVRYALGAVSQDFLFSFLEALNHSDTAQALALCGELMRSGRDVQVFFREFNAFLRQMLSVQWLGDQVRDVGADQLKRVKAMAKLLDAGRLLFFLEKCQQAEQDTRWSNSPRAVLELFALRATLDSHPSSPVPPAPKTKPTPARNQSAPKPDIVSAPPMREPEAPAQMPPMDQLMAKVEGKAKHEVTPDEKTEKAVVEDSEAPIEAQQEDALTPVVLEPAPADLDLPLAQEAETAGQALAATPKDAWNNLLKRLSKENPGLHALVYRGRYGGYEDKVFHLKLDREDEILISLLNDDSRAGPIRAILSEEMGTPVQFAANGQIAKTKQQQEAVSDENVEALARVFGRDKIIIKHD